MRKLYLFLLTFPAMALGQLSVSETGVNYIINFDNTLSGVNNGQYDGSGIVNTPASGQLNSNAWKYNGMSDGSSNFGDNNTTGDAARGTSNGGVTTGGFYAFNTGLVGSPDYAFGIQPDDADFTPGFVTLRLNNNTGADINVLNLAYRGKSYNDQGGSVKIEVSFSYDDVSYFPLPDMTYASDDAAAGSPDWASANRRVTMDTVNWTAGTPLYVQFAVDDSVAGSGQRDEMALDDIIVRGYSVDYVWDGSGWSPSEPSGNLATERALVLPGDSAVLSTSTTLASIVVNAQAALKIDVDLTVTDSALFEATSSGYAQVMGPITGPSIYQTYLTADQERWYNLAFPVVATVADISGIPIQANGTASQTNIWYFDATKDDDNSDEGDWEPVPNTAYAIGDVGFQVFAGDGTYFGEAPFTVQSKGDLINGTRSIAVGDFPTENWNVIPNPYPSVLNWKRVYDDTDNSGKLEPVIYVQDGNPDAASIVWISYNAGTGTPNGLTSKIAPGQSFFVEVTPGTSTLALKNDHRSVSFTPTNKRQTPLYPMLKLFTADLGQSMRDATFLFFDGQLSDQRDSKTDGLKRMNTGYPNLYTRTDGIDYVFNGLNDGFTSRTVDLHFQGDRAGDYIIGIEQEYLPNAQWTIELEDKHFNTRVDLRSGNYSFNHSTNNATDRFVLHLAKSSIGLEEDELAGHYYAYVEDQNLRVDVSAAQQPVDMKVYDMSGKELYQQTDLSDRAEVDLTQWSRGMYLVQLSRNGQTVYQQKVIK